MPGGRTIKGGEMGLEEQKAQRILRTRARVEDKVKRGQIKKQAARRRKEEVCSGNKVGRRNIHCGV